MDWRDTTRIDRFEYEMVDPFDLDASRGWLKNITSATFTEGYYTDTRVSASISAVDSGYISGSLIRIHHYVDDWNYHNELGTFFVSNDTYNLNNEAKIEKFKLYSPLTRVSSCLFPFNYAFSGKSSLEVLEELLKMSYTPYIINPGCYNRNYSYTNVYEIGSDVLSALFDIASNTNLRLDVDGHGNVIVDSYINPKNKSSEYSIAYNDGTIKGKITIDDNKSERSNRVIVVCNYGSNGQISAYADVENDSPLSFYKTGKIVAEVYQANETQVSSKNDAQILANNLIAQNKYAREWSFDSMYIPIRNGSVVDLILPDETVKVMLKSRDISLEPGMICSCTYREV